jgi:hypothetical protein
MLSTHKAYSKRKRQPLTLTNVSKTKKKFTQLSTKHKKGGAGEVKNNMRTKISLTNNERSKLVQDFAPIFDLNSEISVLSSDVLSAAIDKIIEKAKLYITNDNLHKIPLLTTNNNNYIKFKNELNLTRLNTIYNDEKVEYFKDALAKIIEGAKLTYKVMTIAQFNVISMQFVLLFTEILMTIIDPSKGRTGGFDDDIIIKYKFLSQGRTDTCNYMVYANMYSNLNDYGSNYKSLYIDKLPANDFKKKFYKYMTNKNKFSKIIGFENNDEKNTIIPYTNELIPDMVIILFLGELAINDLTKAFIKQIYVLGMTMEMEYADTFYTSPLGFVLHDMTHMDNRKYGISDCQEGYDKCIELLKQNETLFMKYIESDECKLSPSQKYDIYLVLFLIIHEATNEHILSSEKIKFIFSDYPAATWGITGDIITDFTKWTKDSLFTGLIPDNHKFNDGSKEDKELDLLKNATKPYINEIELSKLLLSYLNYMLIFLMNTWNVYFKDKNVINSI